MADTMKFFDDIPEELRRFMGGFGQTAKTTAEDVLRQINKYKEL